MPPTCAPNAALACMPRDPLAGLGRLLTLFETSSLLCLYLAIASLALFQLLGVGLLTLLHYLERRRILRWVNASKSAFRRIPLGVPTPVFMKLMQNVTEDVVARPELNDTDFYCLFGTRETFRMAQDYAAARAARVAYAAPATPGERGEPEEEVLPPGFVAAQEALQAQADLRLDRMQARIEARWILGSKGTIVASAVLLGMLGARVVDASLGWAFWVGLFAGLLASFARDLAVLLVRRR